MKKQVLFLVVIILVAAGLSFQQATGQEKTKAEQEKELKILKEIDQQKKALADQQKAQAEARSAFDEQEKHVVEMEDLLNEVDVKVEAARKSGDASRVYIQRGSRAYRFDEPFVFTPEIENFYGPDLMGGNDERTTWDYSRTVNESTFSKDFTFDVEKTAKNVVMSVMGDCKAGDIKIKIIMPNGKSYSEIVIDEFGNLNWRKSFNISETENQDKTGEWKFVVNSNKAKGFFKISLQAN
jgi:hypothetical protein